MEFYIIDIEEYSLAYQSFATFSSLVFPNLFFFQNVQIKSIALGKRDLALLVTDDEDIAGTGGESLSIGVPDVGNVEGAEMAFNVHKSSNSSNVVSSGNVAEFSGLVLIPGADLALLKVISDGVSLINFRVGESNGPGVVGDNVGDLVWANCFSFDLAKFELGFGVLDGEEGESSLNVIEHAVVLVGLNN